MRTATTWLMTLLGLVLATTAMAHRPDYKGKGEKPHTPPSGEEQLGFRSACENPSNLIFQEINNIRAILSSGGDVWWNGDDGVYVAPKVAPGQPEVSSIFAGAVWLGGIDDGGTFKVAAQTYGRAQGNFDFYTGPLVPTTGSTNQDTCRRWDRFFTVSAAEIDEHLRLYAEAQEAGTPYDPDQIPVGVLGWPARGNEFFSDVWQFELPNTRQGLAGFFDQDGDGNYNPDLGDFPVIEIRGCEEPQYPDEMIFWIYNDNGDIHRQTGAPSPIRMEVQVQAFSYATNDEINNMTFQRYKLINRAAEPIDSTFFAMWVDPDLGCYEDDYIGCDTSRSLGYVYNADAVDGIAGCACEDVNTYCTDIPILGVDYFRGPLDEFGEEIGMSSFTYYNNQAFNTPPPGTTDPNNFLEYYNYLSGSWRDGSPFTFGDDAYQDGDPIDYAFTDDPDDPTGWSMCTQNLAEYDRRTIQASGPFRLEPGAVNELIIGVVWVPEVVYPCPSIRRLTAADDLAQALFDNCFEIPDGPDAPDVDWIELDREIIAVLTNTLPSNNVNESYAEPGLEIPEGIDDSLYIFEGYRIFQFSGPDVSLQERDDPSRVREVAQVDVRNGVATVFNWAEAEESPTEDPYYVPVQQVSGADGGIRHTFRITNDAFGDNDARLVNHKKYYFVAVAYGYNEYQPYDPVSGEGQRTPYLEGRNNLGEDGLPYYTVIPHPPVDRVLNSFYGDGPIITRIEGAGNGRNFLDVSSESLEEILAAQPNPGDTYQGEVTYEPGEGPVEVIVYNPREVVDGEFQLTFFDENMANDMLDDTINWELRNLTDPNSPVIVSEKPLGSPDEQIIKEFGFSVTLGQGVPPGSRTEGENGWLGQEILYPAGGDNQWLDGIPNKFDPIGGGLALDNDVFNYILTAEGERDIVFDPNQDFTEQNGQGLIFTPYFLADFDNRDGDPGFYITPAWGSRSGSQRVRDRTSMANLNNVDIVFTANKDLWSRCMVIETAGRFQTSDFNLPTAGTESFDIRQAPSVSKFDNDGDGLPDEDPENAPQPIGFGWFPGYAIDVETGQRLNLFFGENTLYDCDVLLDAGLDPEVCDAFIGGRDPGADMMFNPTSQILFGGGFSPALFMAGGQHFVYVTNEAYDGCEAIAQQFSVASPTLKAAGVQKITWTGLILPRPGTNMLSYDEGLIPEDVVVKLRVEQPYRVAEGAGGFNGYPTYRFTLDGKEASPVEGEAVSSVLDQINVVPNPYYAYSEYENSTFENKVYITNLPAKCVVTIYTLDGKFIRQYNRNEQPLNPRGDGIQSAQFLPFLEWDVRNNKGIPVASGVYLIHVAAEGLGERTLKWFGVKRPFDPSGN